MALPKLYEQITWHNGTTPALNEDNLNSMSQAIEDIDNRVVEIASTVMEDVPVIEEALKAFGPPARVVKDFAAVQELTDAIEKNAVDVKIKITPKQAGSGTPSPDNIRAITGHSEANITRQNEDASISNVYTISLGDTRYLAELDVTSGELTVKGTYTTLTSVERLSTNTSGQYRFASNGSYADAKVPSSNTQIATIYSSMFNAISADNTYAKVEGIALHANGRIFLYSDAWKTKTAAEVNAILTDTPLQIVYELATPVTVQLTATEVALLYAYNTLWADTGDLALTYDASGVLRTVNSKLDIDTFKSIVASSSDFADFKSKVAAL